MATDRRAHPTPLTLGLFSFGFIAMVAYLIAGPDAYRRDGVSFSVNLGSHA